MVARWKASSEESKGHEDAFSEGQSIADHHDQPTFRRAELGDGPADSPAAGLFCITASEPSEHRHPVSVSDQV